MIGIVVLTHGQMSVECLRAAEMVVGPIAACRALTLERCSSVDRVTDELSTALTEVGADGTGVLILTDMFGGTPTNIAANFLAEERVDILTGINLPMLIKAASARHQMDLVPLADFLREYGQQAILRPADLLKIRS